MTHDKEIIKQGCRDRHTQNTSHVLGAVIHAKEELFYAYVCTPIVEGYTVCHMSEHDSETGACEEMFKELQALWCHHGMIATMLEFGTFEAGTIYWD